MSFTERDIRFENARELLAWHRGLLVNALTTAQGTKPENADLVRTLRRELSILRKERAAIISGDDDAVERVFLAYGKRTKTIS